MYIKVFINLLCTCWFNYSYHRLGFVRGEEAGILHQLLVCMVWFNMSVHQGSNYFSLSWKNGVMGTGKNVFFTYVLFCFIHVFIHSHLAWPQMKNSMFSILVVISFHFCAYISSETKEKKKRKRDQRWK